MTKSRTAAGIGAALGMLILILDGKTAVSGAAEGIDLCIRTAIPSLFPFFVLSGLVTSAFLGSRIPLKLPIVPKGAESLLITGFLGGYPIGAQSIAAAYRSGQLSRSQGERMLAFCSNAGPSFLFGMIAPMFPSAKYAWLLWIIHIISALLTGFLLPKEGSSAALTPGKTITLSDALWQALRVMATVCGWVVLFRIVIAFLQRWILWLMDIHAQVLVMGLLELSNGCMALPTMENVEQRFLMCSGFLAMGGLCVTMQTVSVTRGLSLRYYFPGKGLQAAFSILLAWMILPRGSVSPAVPCIALISVVFLVVSLRKMQNYSSIPQSIGV